MLITPLYAAILGLLFVGLSVRTLRLRRKLKIALGDGDQPILMRAIRVHSNFAEYVPISLLLVFFLELQIGPTFLVHLLCITLLVGRSVHAYGVSQIDENYRFRVAGIALTFVVVISAALRILINYVQSLTV